MSEVPLCSITISSQVPPDEIESLETALQMSSIRVQKSSTRVFGVDDIVLVATVLKEALEAAALIDFSLKAARVLKNWRQNLRSNGIEPEGKLEYPDCASLDFTNASDEDIDEWFSQK